MSRFVYCDNCGERDDWSMGNVPFFNGGVVLQFRTDNGGEEFERTLELCESCRAQLLEAFPELAKLMVSK